MAELGFVLYYGPRGLYEIASAPGEAGKTPGPALKGSRVRTQKAGGSKARRAQDKKSK
ncbi:MAG: hypothetical protein ACK5JT_23215 [Hyphomicrobiaceae bacterium]